MKDRWLIALPALAALVFFVALWSLRGPQGKLRGDEGTYLAMTESLARDGDLWFDGRDRARLEADERPGRKPVILQRVEPRVAYSKPILYPLAAAPFFLLLGERGLVALNALALALALGLLARYLRRLAPDRAATPVAPTVVAFASLGLLVPYLPWRTSDATQAALTIAGLALCLWDLRRRRQLRFAPAGGTGPALRSLLGGVLLGAVVSLRLTNALLAAIPVAALWLEGRRREAVRVAAAIAATLALAVAATVGLAGAPSPYAAVRATFTPETGYPDAEAGVLRGPRSPFDYDRASYDRTKELVEAPRTSAYSAAYFLLGRHTGVLPYYPLAVFLIAAALRRPDRATLVVLAAVAALAVFYLLFLPFNYFGGATCVGNRYFLVSYAALPFALARPLGRRALVAAWAIGLVVAGSALASVLATRGRDGSTQSHAHAGIFRRLPFESSAAAIDGVRDVFWNKELGRFVDPFAGVSAWSFRLSSTDPPAQLEVANRRRDDRLRFLVLSSAPRLDFVYSDWSQRVIVSLEKPLGERGLVEIEPSRPLRVHPLWFRNVWDHGLPYYIRDFRLAIRTPDGRPAEAEVRYLGREPWPRDVFAREVLALDLPSRATAGSLTPLTVRVRNASPSPWPAAGLFPVRLSYRLEPLDRAAAGVEGPRVGAAAAVAPGAELAATLPVAWPAERGRYRLTVDLVIEGVAWFGAHAGGPLGEAVVEIE